MWATDKTLCKLPGKYLFSFYSVSISLYRTKCVTNIQHEILNVNLSYNIYIYTPRNCDV